MHRYIIGGAVIRIRCTYGLSSGLCCKLSSLLASLKQAYVETYRVLETVHVGFCIHVLYWYFILNFTNEDALNKIAWSVLELVSMDGVLTLSQELWGQSDVSYIRTCSHRPPFRLQYT